MAFYKTYISSGFEINPKDLIFQLMIVVLAISLYTTLSFPRGVIQKAIEDCLLSFTYLLQKFIHVNVQEHRLAKQILYEQDIRSSKNIITAQFKAELEKAKQNVINKKEALSYCPQEHHPKVVVPTSKTENKKVAAYENDVGNSIMKKNVTSRPSSFTYYMNTGAKHGSPKMIFGDTATNTIDCFRATSKVPSSFSNSVTTLSSDTSFEHQNSKLRKNCNNLGKNISNYVCNTVVYKTRSRHIPAHKTVRKSLENYFRARSLKINNDYVFEKQYLSLQESASIPVIPETTEEADLTNSSTSHSETSMGNILSNTTKKILRSPKYSNTDLAKRLISEKLIAANIT